MAAPIYRGFSSANVTGVDTRLFDASLVQRDLLNHFETRIGARRNRSTFGSIIHDLLFDLSDPRTEGLVRADASRIISEDPRCKQLGEISVDINHDNHELTVSVLLRLIEFDMNINFKKIFTIEQ